MGYDSGVDDRMKREIKGLVRGLKEPRGTIAPLWILAFPFGIQFVTVPLIIFNMRWGGGAILVACMSIYIAFIVRSFSRTRKFKSEVLFHRLELCLWCHYPFVGLPDRGACTECGKGYDRVVSKALFKDVYQPSYRVPLQQDVNFRRARLWARAIRERDRVRDE